MDENKNKKKGLGAKATKTNAAFSEKELGTNLNKKSEEVKQFLHGFGSISKINFEETTPSYASYKICYYYWET